MFVTEEPINELPKFEEILQLKNDYIEGEQIKLIWKVEEGQLTETLWWPSKDTDEKLILFVVPGNPGVIDYYAEFLSTVHNELGKKIDIVGVSMLGHTHGPHNPSLKKIYSLQDQINHKILCIDKLKSRFTSQDGKHPKFIICGHSIGAYISSQVFKARPNHGIEMVYALYPTLQNIVKTPNGRRWNFMFNERPRNFSASFITNLRYFVPSNVLEFFASSLTWEKESTIKISLSSLLHGHVVENVLSMSDEEMKTVCELDEEFYHEYLDKFIFYFTEGDKWAPIEHYEDMKRRFPKGKVLLCEKNTSHAFVLNHSEIVGKIVAGWISNNNSTH